MYDYNASYLNEQATLLEEFHKIQKYLIEHPLYQIYQSSADYVAGVNEYYINEVSVREGGALNVGDVVLFSNVYYGVITGINEGTEMFTIAEGISFRGAKGETGATGATGAPGAPGRDGTNGTNGLNGRDGKDGLSIYLYDGALSSVVTSINGFQVEVPPNLGRGLQVGDIVFSTYEDTYGAMSIVTGIDDTSGVVATVDYIGQLAGGSGGSKVISYIGSSLANIEYVSTFTGTKSNGVVYIRALMKGEVDYTDNTHDTITFDIELPIKAGEGITIEAQPTSAGGTDNKQIVISASSSGGTTLNRYEININGAIPSNVITRIQNVLKFAKGRVFGYYTNFPNSVFYVNPYGNEIVWYRFGSSVDFNIVGADSVTYRAYTYSPPSSNGGNVTCTFSTNYSLATNPITICYYNDTEITE